MDIEMREVDRPHGHPLVPRARRNQGQRALVDSGGDGAPPAAASDVLGTAEVQHDIVMVDGRLTDLADTPVQRLTRRVRQPPDSLDKTGGPWSVLA